ncbi:MAG TPA: hypothetical protein ENN69_08630 [Spirochaetia bacterium]|nr:hypothetical protein [Spirochaetia bacterium]
MASVFSVIESRHSVRDYFSYELKREEIEWTEGLFEKVPVVGTVGRLPWRLIPHSPIGSGKLYAPLLEPTSAGLVEYGFQGEALVLKLTERGFGSCWMAVGRAVEKNAPAVIVFGKEAGHTVASRLSRAVFKSNRRKDLDELLTHDSLTPLPEQERVLNAMRAAPSAVNKQPWRFTVTESRLLRVRRAGGRPDWSYMDLGIVLCHGYLAALELFGSARVTRLDDEHYQIDY